MRTYEKIETLYKRDTEGTKRLIPGLFRDPTVAFLKDVDWVWTEKVDGTNIRVMWDGHAVSFGGRTEHSDIPASLVNRLNELFGGEENAQLFEQTFGEKEAILFGEGYGKKIQGCGSLYIPDGVDFILFDVLVGDTYLARPIVDSLAQTFGVKSVPVVGVGTLDAAVDFVKAHPASQLGLLPMEGVVCRPVVELRDRNGNRLIVKIKWRDFQEETK